MRLNVIPYYLILLLNLLVSNNPVKAQVANPAIGKENIEAYTDRNLYITGEKIRFSAVIFHTKNEPGNHFSRILYGELITPDGARINAGKYNIEDSKAEGCLIIPEDAVSGVYYLRFYTRWMRNDSPYSYLYTRLKIINPSRTEVLTGHEVIGEIHAPTMKTMEKISDRGIRFKVNKKVFHPREEVKLMIEGSAMQDPVPTFCLAVVPAGSLNDSIPQFRDSISTTSDSGSSVLQYYPETRGISISGRYVDEETGRPLPNARVNLSIIGDKDIRAIRTNSSGLFYFALPGYFGSRDIFLCGEDIPGISSSLFIDNDFCSRPVKLPSQAFHLSEAERETAYKMAVNQKLTSIFQDDTATAKAILKKEETSFYGKPDEILFLDKYVDLPTLDDYFHELVGVVGIRKHEGRKMFRFNTYRAEMTIYDPLVLIDWVVVDDIERVLAMSPKGIERIELVNAPYIKGSITYGGIISFISKKNDFAGIDLPASGTFIHYQFLDDCCCSLPSDPIPENIPDARNTVYWDPDVKPDQDVNAIIHYFAPDTPGVYNIILRGLHSGEEKIIVIEEIRVEKYK